MNNKFIWQINLLNLNEISIKKILFLIKSKKFYCTLLINQIYKQKVTSINLIKNINKYTKNILKQICTIHILQTTKYIVNNDNTIKWLIEIKKNIIETVAIPNKKNHFTLCISSQIGCMLNCSFCYTAKNGFLKNLKVSEITNQIIIAQTYIEQIYPQKKITNIVFMGMGEPLLNIRNILPAIEIIKNKQSYNIHTNKITISTSGIIPNIHLLKKYNLPLALSLHATDDYTRTLLMPINKHYPLKDLMEECKNYAKICKLTIEYIMLKNINDSIENAQQLKELVTNIKCKICLIPFNKFNGTKYESTTNENILKFQTFLKKNGIITTIRKKLGYEINAACGQLAGIFQDKTRRSKTFKKTKIYN